MEMKIACQDKIQEMYQKNIRNLIPWIRDLLEKVDERDVWERVEVIRNPEGNPVCRYHDGEKCFLINGERPLEEAELWCRNLSINGAGGIFLYGSGFGYPIFEIFKRKQEHTVVILFEENLFLLKAMLFYFDLEPLLKTGKLILLAGGIEDFSRAFDKLFFSIVFASCTSPVIAFTHAAKRNFKPIYQKINHFIFSRLALFVFYIGNDHHDNLVGLLNLLANSRVIMENPGIDCLKDRYRGVPAFIIANGPSLDKNIDELYRIRGKGLMICGESAIIPLLKKQITPDILTIIERTKYTYLYHFKDVIYPSDIALLCLGLVDRMVFPSFPGEKIPIFRNAEAINQWINGYLGNGSAIDAGANVSHLAFELAVLLGADPIVFVGQDYAYGPDGVTHSQGAVYNEEKGRKSREYLQSMPIVLVEGNDGTMIPSTKLWKDFRVGLEHKVASHPEKTVINATEGGAKIYGTICETLSYVITKYCNEPLSNTVHGFIAEAKTLLNFKEKLDGLRRLIQSVDQYIVTFLNLAMVANKGKLESSEMIRLAEKDQDQDRPLLESVYKNNINLFQSYIADDLSRCFCQQVVFSYYYLMNHLGLIDTKEKMIEIFRIHHDFFYNLYIVCQSVAVHFENEAEALKQILNEYESKEWQAADVTLDEREKNG